MKRLERILAALTPKRWPVRWRLAAVSAALTLIILVIFAVVVGRLTSNRLQSDFDDELRDNAARLAAQITSPRTPSPPADMSPSPRQMALAGERRHPRGHPSGRRLRAARDPAPWAAEAGHRPTSARCASPRPRVRISRRVRPIRPQHRQPGGDDQPAVAVPRRRRGRRHAARGPGRNRDRGAGDAAGLHAHHQGAGDRLHARPLAPDPRAGDGRRGRRAGAHPGADAPRARRGPLGDGADDAGAARVRRRRLARAAHPADQHPRQPGAAPGAARGDRAAWRGGRDDRLRRSTRRAG